MTLKVWQPTWHPWSSYDVTLCDAYATRRHLVIVPTMSRLRYPLAHHSPAKDELLAIAITHESVVTGDIEPMLEKLSFLIEHADIALQWEGKLTFYFNGWDDDPRETPEIPEIRAFFQALTAQWPYWLHFSEKTGDTIPHVLRLLCKGHFEPVAPGLVGWRFADLDDVRDQLMRLFTGMNRMYERLELPEMVNERISQEVAQLLESALQ